MSVSVSIRLEGAKEGMRGCKGDWVKGGRQKQCQNVSWMEKVEEQRKTDHLDTLSCS